MRLINIYNFKRDIFVFWRTDAQELKITKYTGFFPYYYEVNREGTFKSHKGELLKRIFVSEPAEVAKKRSSHAYEADILFTHRFLIDKVDIIEKCPIKYCFVDIEVLTTELPNVQEAKYPVSCISIFNSQNRKIRTFYLPNYESEYKMIEEFINYMKTERFDIWFSWNVKFDFNYLAHRFPEFAEKISPINKVRYGDGDVFYPAGISVLDYLLWMKKVTLNREKAYTLDHIAQKYLNAPAVEKVDFSKCSEELKQKNINDVRKLAQLEEQKKLVPYFDEIRRLTKVEWEDMEWNSRMIDMLLLEEAKNKKIILPMKPNEERGTLDEEVEFEGAYREVFESGRFENVGKYDLSSAYPFAIIDFCLDPANIANTKTDKTITIADNEFLQNDNALLPTVTKKLINLKNDIKAELKKTSVDSVEYKDIKSKYEAIKSLVNSAYGVFGNRFFRMYDPKVASATTFIVRSLLHYVKAKLDEKGYKVIYVDTDSVFIQSEKNLTELLNQLVQEWAKNTFNKEKVNIEFDYEGFFEKILILTKCRYLGYLRKKSGELEEEIKGIEAKRKDSTIYMKEFQKTLINKILNKEEQTQINQWILSEINNFRTQKLQDIAFPCKLARQVHEYKSVPIFVRALSNTPNVSFSPKVGDAFYYVFMQGKDDTKKEMVQAFDEEHFSHILREEIDWQKMLERNIIMKLESIFEAMNWKITDVYTAPPTSKICKQCGKEKTNGRFPEKSDICATCVKHNENPKVEKPKIVKPTKQTLSKINDVSTTKQVSTKVNIKKSKKETILDVAIHKNNVEIKEEEIIVNHSFQTKADVTERTIMVSEAFGLGIDEEKSFTIYDNAHVKIKTGDIIYVTGDSGSGKSWILKNVFEKMSNTISIDDLQIDDNEVVVEGVGKNLNDALLKLNIAGLGDAFLYLRKYSQLSDGQKYRYRVAKFIDHEDKNIWILDEFCATLDRTTAKIVAYNIQKIARKLNKTVVVATTHTDLLDYIRPNVHILKGYESDVNINYYKHDDWKNKKLDMLNDMKVEIGTLEDYEKLKRFHYRQANHGAVKAVYKMSYQDELIGVIMISYPHLALKGRNIYTNNEFAKMTTENCKALNDQFECIARVIIHPKYRGIGASYYFINEYITKFAQTKYVETVAVMANYNPFFEKAGMTRVDVEEDIKRIEWVKGLEQYGYNLSLLSSARYNETIYNKLTLEQQESVRMIVLGVLSRYKGQISTLFKGNKTPEEIVHENLFVAMKELMRADTVYLVKKLKEE